MAAVWKHFKDGGWGMYVILFWSIITIGVIVERALYLFGASINKDVFLATMQKCILAGDVAKAVKMCSAANAPLARIVQAGLVKVNRPDEEVQAAMDEAALREIPRIAKRTGYLALLVRGRSRRASGHGAPRSELNVEHEDCRHDAKFDKPRDLVGFCEPPPASRSPIEAQDRPKLP